jgi:hypothetical protein
MLDELLELAKRNPRVRARRTSGYGPAGPLDCLAQLRDFDAERGDGGTRLLIPSKIGLKKVLRLNNSLERF